MVVIAGAAESLVEHGEFGSTWEGIWSATVASRFVKTERGDETNEIMAALQRIEAELTELRQQVQRP